MLSVFMDDFSIFAPSFDVCLEHLMQILNVCGQGGGDSMEPNLAVNRVSSVNQSFTLR